MCGDWRRFRCRRQCRCGRMGWPGRRCRSGALSYLPAEFLPRSDAVAVDVGFQDGVMAGRAKVPVQDIPVGVYPRVGRSPLQLRRGLTLGSVAASVADPGGGGVDIPIAVGNGPSGVIVSNQSPNAPAAGDGTGGVACGNRAAIAGAIPVLPHQPANPTVPGYGASSIAVEDAGGYFLLGV